jgi:CBS domain-containing protein
MRQLTVGDVMTRDVAAVRPDTSLDTVNRLLTRSDAGGVPVVDAEGRVVGVVSGFDLVDPDRNRGNVDGYATYYSIHDGWRALWGDPTLPSAGRVAEVMSRDVLGTSTSTSVLDASRQMLGLGVHRLLVEEEGVLVGVVTTVDLIVGFLRQRGETVSARGGEQRH